MYGFINDQRFLTGSNSCLQIYYSKGLASNQACEYFHATDCHFYHDAADIFKTLQIENFRFQSMYRRVVRSSNCTILASASAFISKNSTSVQVFFEAYFQPCSVQLKTQIFQDSPSHRILRHIYEALNIDENKN